MAERPQRGILINIDVDDLERGTRFYTTALGLRVGRRFTERWIELVGGSAPIYLLEKKPGSAATAAGDQQRSYARHWTPVHLDFLVDAIEPAIAAALAAGATLERPIPDDPYGRIAVLADPFGHGLCLIEMNERGYDAEGI
jgi:predicted enzyme related to lactoylglutathione lyase